MSKFYGQVFGMSSTSASRRGGSDIKVSAQSYDGSVIVKLDYNKDNKLRVRIETEDDSSSSGDTKFVGTFNEFNDLFDKVKQNKIIFKKLLDYYHLCLDNKWIDLIAANATGQEYDVINWIELTHELEITDDLEHSLFEFGLIDKVDDED